MRDILFPWIVPKSKIIEFCNEANEGTYIQVSGILPHTKGYYLVLVKVSYPFIEDHLAIIIKKEV